MAREDYFFEASDGRSLATSRWVNSTKGAPIGLLQIAHGKAEHRLRYNQFAEFLAQNGFVVVAHDHRGHGGSVDSIRGIGTFGCKNGWERAVQDLIEAKRTLAATYPGLPLFLLGHSMGSYLARSQILEDSAGVSGVILSGTSFNPPVMSVLGRIVATLVAPIIGFDTPSPFLENIATGGFNNSFRPNRTTHDWLTRDEKTVDAYVDDPLCGFPGSASFYLQLLRGLKTICNQNRVNQLPGDLPILLIAGQCDPVGNFTKDVTKCFNQYQAAGIKALDIKLYPDGRHELLHELNREEVYSDLLGWLTARI